MEGTATKANDERGPMDVTVAPMVSFASSAAASGSFTPIAGMGSLCGKSPLLSAPVLAKLNQISMVEVEEMMDGDTEVGWLPEDDMLGSGAEGPSIRLDDDERETLEMLREHADEESGAIAGYFIEELLGTGAFARVYVGRHQTTCQQVAIKQILRVPNFASGPVHEYTMVRRLKFEHIVEAYDCVTDGGEQFIIFEMAEGGDLYDRLEVEGDDGLTRETCRRYLREAAQAVDFCHKRDIVHGDIKLENMLLHNGKIKLCDFGLAGQKDELRCGRPYGTSAYMAPELVRIRSKSARYHVHPSQDVWGMGIVIYAVLFNDLPWEKALLTDPDYKEVEESGGVASSVANFGSLSAAMRTLLAEMLCSDYMRRCPVSELVDFLAERRAWFTSEEIESEMVAAGDSGGEDGCRLEADQGPTEASAAGGSGSGWRKMSSTIPGDVDGDWSDHRTRSSQGLLARSGGRRALRHRSSSLSQLPARIKKPDKGGTWTQEDFKLQMADMFGPTPRPRAGSF